MTKGNFDNTMLLTRFILRRERINSTVWILVTALFKAFVVFIFENGIASDEASRMEMASVIENPAMVAMIGPAYGIENYTMGAMYTNMMLVFTALAVIVMNILFIVRHTRADEEKGRYEVVRSLPTGRMANLNAAMIAAVIINALMAIAVGLALFIAGDESMCFGGSMLWGALLGVIGLLFAAVAALFSQASSSSRGAIGYSMIIMGIFYMMRAVGDISMETLSLISPVGLISRAQAYVENYWFPVPVILMISAVIAALAYKLNGKRDIDQGLLPDKKGKAAAGKLLRTPFGLSLKLSKTPLIVGIAVIFLIGASYGSIMGDIEGFIETNEMYRQLMLLDEDFPMLLSFLGMINFIASLMALVPMLLYVLKAKSEEKEIRSELILATPVSRTKYLGGYVIIAFASSVILQLSTAIGLWLSGTAVLDNPADMPLGDLLAANLVYLPALWVIIGIAVFLIGFAPKASGFIWAVYGAVFFIGFIGRTPAFPDWFPKLTPYGYIPQLPMEEANFLALGILTAIAAALTTAGFFFYNKRDINAITH
jgi:ABC-2 type transport system permease protein